VIDHIARAGEVTIEDATNCVTFTTEKVLLRADKATCRFELQDRAGNIIWR